MTTVPTHDDAFDDVKKIKWPAWLVGIAALIAAALGITITPPGPGDEPDPTPTPIVEPSPEPDPQPTPSPDPQPTPEKVACIADRIGWAACCDAPDTPDLDEGYSSGWPTATGEHIDRVWRESQGCITDIEFRTGPYADGIGGPYPQYGPNREPPDWSHLTARVAHANLRGIRPWLDIGDCWAINVPSRNPIGLQPNEMTGRLEPFYATHARTVAEVTCGQGHDVGFELGNECWFKGRPSRQWNEDQVDTIRGVEGCEEVPIRTNARTGVEDTRPNVSLASHGFPGRGFEPPLNSGWLSESDNEPIGAQAWRRAVIDLAGQGIKVTVWPGPVVSTEWDRILRALVVEGDPGPDPEPEPEPATCETFRWFQCSEHKDGEAVHFEGAVRAAVQHVLDTDPRYTEGQTLPEEAWDDYAAAVGEELNRQGYCASKIQPPFPSRDEIAVWKGPDRREHWDLLRGAGEISEDIPFLAFMCRDGL